MLDAATLGECERLIEFCEATRRMSVDGRFRETDSQVARAEAFHVAYFFEAVAAFLAACHFFIVAESLFLAAVLIFRWGLPADTVVCGCCPTGRAFRDAPVRPGVWFRSSASSCSILAFSASSPLIASSMSLLFCIMKPPSYRSLTYVGFFIG